MQFDEGELGRAVDRHEEVEPAFFGSHLGEVDVEEAEWISFELSFGGFLALDLGQTADAVALETAVQR
jgi:hypothetical protein